MKPTTVNEYINSFPDNQKARLTELHEIIKSVLPGTNEAIKWGNPAITDKDGMILVVFAGYKQHINLVVTPSTKQALESELANYKTGKGSVQFSYEHPLPTELIKKMVAYRAKEYRENGVRWM